MKKSVMIFTGLLWFSAVSASEGIITTQSANDVATTATKLMSALKTKGLTVFAHIDHAAGAKKVGKELLPTQLVIFGNPKVGTPLMQCARTAAIDLPQKALIWQDDAGKVWLSYNDPAYVSDLHGLQECAKVTEKIKGVLKKFTSVATQK